MDPPMKSGYRHDMVLAIGYVVQQPDFSEVDQ
jgi:hypothetical protein